MKLLGSFIPIIDEARLATGLAADFLTSVRLRHTAGTAKRSAKPEASIWLRALWKSRHARTYTYFYVYNMYTLDL